MTARHVNQFLLPAVVDPAETVCVTIEVPNDQYHIFAFWQALSDLTRWFNWQRDPDHIGKDVAAVWERQYNLARESTCMNYIVRQNPTNSCDLQRSFDGGETWESWANVRLCAESTITDVFGPGSDQPGSRSQPGEQPGGGDPELGQCFDLDLTVQGSSMLLIPLAIKSGWTLTFTQVKGAWNDGNIGHDWVCPTGHAFFLGTCSALVEGTDSSDPIPTLPHMQLIIRLPDGTYDELPLDGSEYTIPPGQPDGNVFLLANDSVLSDNQGSISLHLLACNTSATCYEWDFSTGEHGFVTGGYYAFGTDPAGRNVGVYGAGQWDTTDGRWNNVNERGVSISRAFTTKHVVQLELEFDYQRGENPYGAAFFRAGYTEMIRDDSRVGNGLVLRWNGSLDLDHFGAQVWSEGYPDGAFSGMGVIHSIRIWTTDGQPEGTTAC